MKDQIEKYYADNQRALVKAYKRRCGDNIDVAEDVVQDAFVLALTYSDSYNPEYCNFKAWFDRILLNAFRKRMKEDRMMGMTDELDEEVLEPVEDNSLFDKALTDEIRLNMAKHPPHITEILDLYFVKQYGFSDIQKVTGHGMPMIKQNVARFKEAMRGKYGQTQEGGVR